MKEKFIVTGMTCAACQAHVEKAVSQLDGVQSVDVNLLSGTLTAEHTCPADDICRAVDAAGYHARLPEEKKSSAAELRAQRAREREEERRAMKRRLTLSIVFLVPLFYLGMGHMMGLPLPGILTGVQNSMVYALAQLVLTLPIIYLNDNYFIGGFRALRHRAPNMDSLVAVGAAASLAYSLYALFVIGYALGHGDLATAEEYHMNHLYLESAGMILTLVTVGKYLEIRSKGRTGAAMEHLLDLAPKTASVLRDGTEVSLPVEEVRVGDRIVVRPGEAVPVDGTVLEGESAVDESALTGESIPAEKSAGSRVSAATINRNGTFTMEAMKVGDDTAFAQIIRLVEDASASKAPIARLADKVAGVFVPVVLAIAAVTFLVWLLAAGSVTEALTASVAVVVISCPCALGLATPVAIMVGTGKGAELGVLFKSAQALETLHSIDTIVMDKTGTLTQGVPRVTDVLPEGDMTAEQLLCIAASLESASEHPLAEAVVREAKERNIPLCAVSGFEALPGRGLKAEIDGDRYLAGNARLMAESGIAPDETRGGTLAGEGRTLLYFAENGRLIGALAAADIARPTSAGAVRALQVLGLSVVLLSGDSHRTAEAIGRELGLTDVIAEVLPADKEQEIVRLQSAGHKVAMVGDGINDAPALSRADVGIAIGAGTDVAIQSADVVLVHSDPMDIAAAVELSRATIRNIKQDLFWAFCYNCIGIPLAAGVFYPLLGWQLSPMFAAAAMSLSSVSVVTNALRLRRFRPERQAAASTQPPAVLPEADRELKGEPNMKNTVKLNIEGMMCAHCQSRVQSALSAVPGVESAAVDLEGKCATVTGTARTETLKKAVADAGYEVTGTEAV